MGVGPGSVYCTFLIYLSLSIPFLIPVPSMQSFLSSFLSSWKSLHRPFSSLSLVHLFIAISFPLFFHPLHFCSLKFATLLQHLTHTMCVCLHAFTCTATRRDPASCSVIRAVLHHEERDRQPSKWGGEIVE